MACYPKRKSGVAGEVARDSVQENSDIIWSGNSWICSNQLKHYSAFRSSDVIINVHSFVIVNGCERREYVAHVEDFYEDQLGEKWVRVRWFDFPREIKKFLSDLETNQKEIFMTPVEQDVSAECINSLAVVLTPDHFVKCSEALELDLPPEYYFCHRQFRNEQIEPFCLNQLRGYSTQFILSALQLNSTEQGEASAPPKPEMQVHKFDVPETKPPLVFKANENIELLSRDIGKQGCWFRCKVLDSTEKHLRVEYYDCLDVDGPGKVQERVSSSVVATPDNLGMRCARRLTVRPWPSEDSSHSEFEVGTAVDAWLAGGWWEGVVIGQQNKTPKQNNFLVYLPGENRLLTFERKNIRISKDWIDGKWVKINSKPDILSFITLDCCPKPMQLPVLAEAAAVRRLSNSSKPTELKVVKELNFKKRLISKYQEEVAHIDCGGNGNDSTMG